VFFVQNYFPGLLDHTWSLAVEEHFYLLLPVALLGLIAWDGRSGNPFRRLPVGCLWVGGILLFLRILTNYLGKYGDQHNLEPTHLRLDSLLCGVLLSYYYHFRTEETLAFARKFRWPLIAVGSALLVPVYDLPPWDFFIHTLGFTYAYVAFSIFLLVALTFAIPASGLVSVPFRVIAFFGTYSYGIYLWHMPVKIWGSNYLHRWFGWEFSPRGELLVYLVGSLVVGIIFSAIIEFPMLRLRDRWFPSQSKAVEPSMPPDSTLADHAKETAPALPV
jgi:peptidoglycan/LPS O-acetylase OafA/YrhL